MDNQQKRRLKGALLFMSLFVVLLIGYALFVRLAGFGLPCVFQKATGLKCAGCGLSRAAAALLLFDFKGAFAYNAVWPLYLGYCLWAIPSVTIPYVKQGRMIFLPRPLWLNFVVFGLILLYGFFRNFI